MASLLLLRVGAMRCLFGAGGWAWAYRLWVSRASAAAFSLAARRSALLRAAAAVRFATCFRTFAKLPGRQQDPELMQW